MHCAEESDSYSFTWKWLHCCHEVDRVFLPCHWNATIATITTYVLHQKLGTPQAIFFCFWKLWKCIASAVLFLEIVYYVQWISFPYNSSLQIFRQVWNDAINLHMQAHMQNSQKISNFICQSKYLHIQLSVYFDLYFINFFLLNENINFTSSWIMS